MADRTIQVDFTRLTSDGYGTIYGAKTEGLRVGQLIAITDDDADTIQAEVIEVCGDAVKIHARWDQVLHTA
jgi:hypothetical protein